MSSRRGMCPMRLETGDRIVVKRADWKGPLEKKVMSALGQKHMCGAKGDVRFGPRADIACFIRTPRRPFLESVLMLPRLLFISASGAKANWRCGPPLRTPRLSAQP